jgi:hypothetical protein
MFYRKGSLIKKNKIYNITGDENLCWKILRLIGNGPVLEQL